MREIKILLKEKDEKGWEFEVEVKEGASASRYQVILRKDYYQKLTGGKGDLSDLVKRSFEFLLKREPKESILSSFDLSLVQKYFPEYEKMISS